ncbi:MAG: ankyrin repeat domain-containing protein [Holophagaceae bacterium]
MDPLATLLAQIEEGFDETAIAMAEADPELLSARAENGLRPALSALYAGRRDLAHELANLTRDLDVHEAAALGRLERMEAFAGSPGIGSHAPDGFTPLHLAAFFSHPSVVDWLLEHGADPSAEARNGSGLRPLHSALAGRDERAAFQIAAALLVRGADVDARQNGGYTSLHAAAKRGSGTLAELLLGAGADPALRTDQDQSAADLAAAGGHHLLAERLRGL